MYQKSSYNACFLRYGVRQTSVILGHVLPFYPTTDPENQNLDKMEKKPWRYYPFTPVYHKWKSYDVRFLRSSGTTDRVFCHFGSFFALWPSPNYPKNQNFKKWKQRPGDIIISHLCTTNEAIIWCMVPEIWSAKDRIFSHFGLMFGTDRQRDRWTEGRKNGWTDGRKKWHIGGCHLKNLQLNHSCKGFELATDHSCQLKKLILVQAFFIALVITNF